MTQHIATAKSGLCRFKGKNVAVMFGFDRPLNEMGGKDNITVAYYKKFNNETN